MDSVGDGGSWGGVRGSGGGDDIVVGGVGRGLPSAVDAAGKSVLEVVLGLDPSEVRMLVMT